jgi:hypothetical protein
VIIGSGETSPTMVSLHQELLAIAGSRPKAVIVETPYGFQENADEVSSKARRYFQGNVGAQVTVPPGLRAPADRPGPDLDRGVAALRSADWVFTGPGSPSYAHRQWRGSQVGQALWDRLARGGITVFASAAACTVGRFTLPVYEIYKVGAEPSWLDGVDLLQSVGLDSVLIPHFDNAEGGTHDTRRCYVGERRLRILEDLLPPSTSVIGVDEHTALLLDLEAETATVRGRGAVTIRRRSSAERLEGGTTLPLSQLRAMAAGTAGAWAPPQPPDEAEDPGTPGLVEAAHASEQRFDRAARDRDGEQMVAAILELEEAIAAWSTDTLDSSDADRARAVLRSLVVRLGDMAQAGLVDPSRDLAPIVDPLLTLRTEMRERREFALADAIRDVLSNGGVEIRDTPDGCRWSVRASRPATRQPVSSGESPSR